MKYYLSKVTADEIESMGMDGMCIAPDGTAFWYEVNFDGETISITDGIGRFVPIDYTAAGEFAKAFLAFQNYAEVKADQELELMEILTNGFNVNVTS